jgi:hypothetical protein
MRKIALSAAALVLVMALLPVAATAKARKVKSSITIDVNGIIDRHGSVSYAFGGDVGAKGLTFKCMEGRTVKLFRVDANGTGVQVASTRSKFFGAFFGTLELPLDQITGSYYATVPVRKIKSKSGKLKCLAARSPTFLVQVPAGLL